MHDPPGPTLGRRLVTALSERVRDLERGRATQGAEPDAGARAPELSLVLPLFDEEARVAGTLAELRAALARTGRDFEIVAVDDGSRDATAARLAAEAAGDARLRVLTFPRNRGKGAAVRAGVLAARGAYVVFLDADLSTDLEALPRLLERLESGADVVFGSRRVQGARVLARQPRGRELAGRVFSWLARRAADPHVRDFTCGFKGFRAAAARALFEPLATERWAFDAEIARRARRLALAREELAVRWTQRGASKVRVPSAALRSLVDLARVAFVR